MVPASAWMAVSADGSLIPIDVTFVCTTPVITHTEQTAAKRQLEQTIRDILQVQSELDLAVLVGSRSLGTASAHSDWDIALKWSPTLDWRTLLGNTEILRRQLAQAIGVAETAIDLIDLPRANLAMRASAAEEGKPLKGTGMGSLSSAHLARDRRFLLEKTSCGLSFTRQKRSESRPSKVPS